MINNLGSPSAIVPAYSTSQPNQPLSLYEGEAEIFVDGQKVASGRSKIILEWLPSPGIKFRTIDLHLDIPLKEFQRQTSGKKIHLLLVDKNIKVNANLIRLSMLPDGIEIACNIDRSTKAEKDEPIEYVLGHLVNFPSILGSWVSYAKNTNKIHIHEARARVVLETREWKVVIDSVSNVSEIIEEIHVSGGYAITSSVKIERLLKDKTTISTRDIEDINKALYFFLSFAIGQYTPIVLPIGCSSLGLEVWYEWDNWLIPQWEKTTSWFSAKKNCESLTQAFPGFMKIWNEPNSIWSEPMQRSIFWYVESNRSAVDPTGRIIWIQSALELLSWTRFVTSGEKSEKSFKNVGGMCEKIKIFLDSLNIPTTFSNTPENLKHISKFIEENRATWQKDKHNKQRDLESYLYLKAFVEVRNDIVHPKGRYKPINPLLNSSDNDRSFWLRVEALNLGLWYLEMALLRLFKYEGNYVNRLQSRKIESVPWANLE